ncbi:hypothetical protein PV08_01621 [Exophiala spinifera]|uniref:FAD dependent oxidoreductase domain-containing protein n=1 Tax=Exophiala spinifera TaxID=91928 RepID=A0A0D2A8F5_9EURO|nr:uncharacterized protein PV08_01621 [Exophiala spinifera]KIW21042.1 hypothetical protein PV08_01621 [Exophiala spinifera]
MTRQHTFNSLPAHETFPNPTSTVPCWRTELHPLDNYRSTEELPSTSDIVIIGAGMTGISIAYHLLQETSPESAPSITILEARQVCSGATGRNGGHLKLASWIVKDKLEQWSVEASRELIRSHLAHIMALKNVIEKEEIDCDFLVTRSFDVFMDSGEARQSEGNLRMYKDMAMDELEHVDLLGPKYLEAVTGVANSKGAFSVPAAQLWPYKFVTGLLNTFIDRENVNLQTTTQVTSISDHQDPNGFFRIETSGRGTILARKVVYATNAYTAGILPMYHDTIVPVRGTGAHIVPLRTSKDPTLALQRRVNTYTYNIFHRRGQVDHLVHRPDGGVVIGGARVLFIDDPEQWSGVVDDGSLILQEQVTPYFERVMTEHYQDWRESGAKVDKLWTGIMGYTTDGAAHVGNVPGRKDQYVCAGFNGAGMVYIFLTARGIARMMLGTANFEDSGIPRVFKATRERLEKQ